MTKDSNYVNLAALFWEKRHALNVRKQNHRTNYSARNPMRKLGKMTW